MRAIIRSIDGGAKPPSVAKEFDVSLSTVYYIIHGRYWVHIPRPWLKIDTCAEWVCVADPVTRAAFVATVAAVINASCWTCGSSEQGVERGRECGDCRRTGRRESHHRTKTKPCRKEYYIQKAKRVKDEHRKIVREAKDRPCADCGGRFPWYCMDFDHVRGVKNGNVSRLAGGIGRAVLLAEMLKCEVVCANCHRKRTFERDWHVKKTPAAQHAG